MGNSQRQRYYRIIAHIEKRVQKRSDENVKTVFFISLCHFCTVDNNLLHVDVHLSFRSSIGNVFQKYFMKQLRNLSDNDLITEVSKFKNAKELWKHYGYISGASYTKYILPRLKKLEFRFPDVGRKFTDEQLIELSKQSKSISDICRLLGTHPTGRSHNHIKKRLLILGITFDIKPTFNASRKRLITDYLVIDGPQINIPRLKRKLIKERILEEKCTKCGIGPMWNNEPLILHLDHINGKRNDNCVENLRLLCPNCHSQTETYAKTKSL